ncbi:gamma interferon inducible lysosomal thiol reductase (GILT) domain-containing protein [Phthorimaea operculella]|nr:gamma interferon inducible lysosomal thiol reductase (GILT) domain-containing protein [Phthorimaea operculella]
MKVDFYNIFAILYLACIVKAQQLVNGKIKISIVTSSGCGDTARFIHEQLIPAYNKYSKYMQVEFAPWGRTKRLQDGSLQCQFGPADCWANRVHRCALNLLPQQHSRVHYMSCEFTKPYSAYSQKSYDCAQRFGVDLRDLDLCVTETGVFLDDAAEEAARLPMMYINNVPAITFNDNVYDVLAHGEALRGLDRIICYALADQPWLTGVTRC